MEDLNVEVEVSLGRTWGILGRILWWLSFVVIGKFFFIMVEYWVGLLVDF